MSKLTAEDMQRHLKNVVDRHTLDQVPADNQKTACDGMCSALNEQHLKTGRGR